jgi:hypothetical protein
MPLIRCVLAEGETIGETALGAYRQLTAGHPAGSFLIERPGDRHRLRATTRVDMIVGHDRDISSSRHGSRI